MFSFLYSICSVKTSDARERYEFSYTPCTPTVCGNGTGDPSVVSSVHICVLPVSSLYLLHLLIHMHLNYIYCMLTEKVYTEYVLTSEILSNKVAHLLAVRLSRVGLPLSE